MNLPTETFGNVVVVHTPEELGRDQADDFQTFVTSLPHQRVVVDLDNTETLDSLGLTSLLDAQDKLFEAGGNIKVATTNAYNRKILEITRLDRQLEVFESVIDAVKSFR
jgi:anti-sigma B factor antagonist